MLKRNGCLTLALILILCVFCGGCSEDEKNVGETENTPSIVLQMQTPSGFNPLLVENQSVRDALSLSYEPLFVLNDKMQLKGVLAESITVADDCMSAIVKLKESVLWHDGVKMTAADVVHTVNFIKENPSSPYFVCVKNIADIMGISPRTIKMTFSEPYAQIAYSLYFPVIASHNPAPEEKIVGTGPYCVESYAEAVSLNLKHFESWHGGEVNAKKVAVSVVRDMEAATSAFNAGSINTITSSSFDSENSTPRPDSKRTIYKSLQYEFVMFNHSRRQFASPVIRSAISNAIDRTKIAQEAYQGVALPANTPIHPESAIMAESSVGSQYNLSAASEALFMEGYFLNESTGLLQNKNQEKISFRLLVNKENQKRVNAAYQIASQMLLAGIEVTVTELGYEKYISEIRSGNYDAYIGGVTLSNMYDYEFFFDAGDGITGIEYSSDSLTAAMDAIALSPSDGELSTALVSFEEAFQREQPLCGLVFRNDTLYTVNNIEGKLGPNTGAPYININKWSVK